MYKTGHWGTALLVWAPVGIGLLLAGYQSAAVVGGAGMVALARLPDYDQRVPLVSHRGSTHTLAFALLVGLLCGTALLAVASSVGTGRALALGGFGFAVGTLSILSHLLADALTPAGVTVLWPLSGENYSLNLVRADNTFANYGLLAVGVLASLAVVAAFR
jgi:inner membrane protein